MFCRRWFLIAIALAAFPHLRQALAFAQQSPDPAGTAQIPSSPAKPDVTEIPIQPAGDGDRVAPSAPSLPAVKIPNFTSCPIAELQHTVRELAHLKPVPDQSKLAELLDKIGDQTIESARKTPNLISHEAVVSEQGGVKMRQNFSYLVLKHALGSKGVVLDEFRVDLKTGEKFQTEEIEKTEASNSLAPSLSSLDLPSLRSLPGTDSPPMSQGFGNDWLHFYPANRSESTFRYLGEQQMNGHRTLVVAFAQKPGSVRLPAIIAFENKTLPVYQQGVAWVDPSDFKIVRLRTDLLSPPAGVPLRQLTADIQFVEIRIAETASPLWLPRQVVVTTSLGGVTLRETHTYSNYRLFRAHSKVRLNP